MMSLDSITLYLVATMVAALLGAMMVFFGRQENSPALKWWGTAYLLGAGLMICAGLVAIFLAVDAERRSLEDIARPFTAARARRTRRPETVGARAR